jgi:hypothetical protein
MYGVICEFVRPATLFLFVLALTDGRAQADMVVVANRTQKKVEFREIHENSASKAQALTAGDSMSLAARGRLTIEFTDDGATRQFNLRGNRAYFFYREKGSLRLNLRQIGFGGEQGAAADAGEPQTDGEEPQRPDASRREAGSDLLTIRVKLLADEEERATRSRWEDRLRQRLAKVSAMYERAARVRFEATAIEVWKSDDRLADFEESLRDFEQKVAAQPANLAIGFTSQYEIPTGRTTLGGTHGPLRSHILIREWSQHVSESERTEILVHELGHYLGAVHSPEADSVMRAVLGDRQALSRRFQIHLDPLNLLAVCLVSEDLREKRSANISPQTLSRRRQLAEIYRALAAALPDDPLAGEYLRLVSPPEQPLASDSVRSTSARDERRNVDELSLPGSVRSGLRQGAAPPAAAGSDREELAATKRVLQVIVAAAEANHRLPVGQEAGHDDLFRRRGDRLTEYYVHAAATAATSEAPDVERHALLLAMATAVETSDWLRKLPVVGALLREIESDDRRAHRLQVLGVPTLRSRHDLAEHFFISAAIACGAGRSPAETAGLAKELRDANGGSGFSFSDWTADLSGIALAEAVANGKVTLPVLVKRFRVTDYLPPVTDLPDGLSRTEFAQRFGSTSDERFRHLDADIRRQIAELPAYR